MEAGGKAWDWNLAEGFASRSSETEGTWEEHGRSAVGAQS